MEFIKLLLFLSFGYFLRQLNFLVIISIIWGINFFVGLYLNKEYFQNNEGWLNYCVLKVLNSFEYIYNYSIKTKNKINDTQTGKDVFKSIEKIDKYYLEGRRYLFGQFKRTILPPLPPPPFFARNGPFMPPINGPFPQPRMNQNQIVNQEEVNNFLDNIIKKSN